MPDDALYGVQTLRALENFPITGTPLREFPSLIDALAAVKEEAKGKIPALGYTVPYAVGNILLTAWGPVIVGILG